jgi:hypothetical protein
MVVYPPKQPGEFSVHPGLKFICQSLVCRREIEIKSSVGGYSQELGSPQCTCGAKMKRVYSKPVLLELRNVTILSLLDIPAQHGGRKR